MIEGTVSLPYQFSFLDNGTAAHSLHNSLGKLPQKILFYPDYGMKKERILRLSLKWKSGGFYLSQLRYEKRTTFSSSSFKWKPERFYLIQLRK